MSGTERGEVRRLLTALDVADSAARALAAALAEHEGCVPKAEHEALQEHAEILDALHIADVAEAAALRTEREALRAENERLRGALDEATAVALRHRDIAEARLPSGSRARYFIAEMATTLLKIRDDLAARTDTGGQEPAAGD